MESAALITIQSLQTGIQIRWNPQVSTNVIGLFASSIHWVTVAKPGATTMDACERGKRLLPSHLGYVTTARGIRKCDPGIAIVSEYVILPIPRGPFSGRINALAGIWRLAPVIHRGMRNSETCCMFDMSETMFDAAVAHQVEIKRKAERLGPI